MLPPGGPLLSPQLLHWASLLMILTALSAVTAKLLDAPPLRSANDRSRWCTVWSLVERNTYQIDEIRQRSGWDTIDLVRHKDHFYSSKPPLLPRLVAELYRGVKRATGWTLTDHTGEITRIILFAINILPMGWALWAFARIVPNYCRDPFGQLYLMACACWGTMLLPYLTVFNNHTLAAAAFFGAIVLAIEITVEERRQFWRYALCGVCAGFGVANELPAALFGLLLFFVLVQTSLRRTFLAFVPAALLPLIAFLLTNHDATGSWKPFYAAYGTSKYVFTFEGVPSYWSDPKGIDRPRDSTAIYLFHCVLGHHGILSLSPIYLLTLAGWCMPRRLWMSRLRVFYLLGPALTVATLGFYLMKTENYNYGGVSVALRWMLWLTPFWLLGMIPVVSQFGRARWFRTLACVLLAASVFSAWYPANAPWAQNWLFQLLEQAKLIDYSDPPLTFQQTHYSWISRLPAGDLQPDYWIEFSSQSPDGPPEKLRLADGGPGEGDLRVVKIERYADRRRVGETAFLLDSAKFNAGEGVEQFLVGRQDGGMISEEDRTFFRGIPRRMQYLSARIRYEKTPLRTDAFKCQTGYTYVTIKGDGGATRQFLRDVWYCDEVPFGILKWEEKIQDGGSHELISRQLWTPTAMGQTIVPAPKAAF
jgi:hypothetical protein